MKSNNFNLSISQIKSMVLIKKKTMAALQSEKNIQLSTAFFFQNCVKYRRTKSTLIFILNPPGRCIRTCGRKSSYGIFGRYVLTLLVSVGHLCDLWAGFAEIQKFAHTFGDFELNCRVNHEVNREVNRTWIAGTNNLWFIVYFIWNRRTWNGIVNWSSFSWLPRGPPCL